MNIQILFFGITTDLVGAPSIAYTIEDNTTIKILKNLLKKEFEGLVNIFDFAIAINEHYAEDDQLIHDGDVIAVIPPVSGG